MIVTPEQCLAALREHELLPEKRSAVFVAGSLVRGWGNARSDLDVYVVVHEPWQGKPTKRSPVSVSPGTVPVKAFVREGRRWDVEYWLDSQVDELLEAVSWEAFESGARNAYSLAMEEIALMQRLPHCIVAEGEEWVRRRSEQVAASAVARMIVAGALDYYDNAAEDAVGMLEVGDVESAVIATRIAFGCAVEALLASHGEFTEQEKWRARRVRAVSPEALPFDDYWAIETMRGLDPANPAPWIEHVIGTCQEILAEVQL